MYYEDALNIYKKIELEIDDSNFFMRNQHLIEIIRKDLVISRFDYESKKNKLFIYTILIINFFGWFLLSAISSFTLLRCRIKKIRIAHYMIDINNDISGYDRRSKWIFTHLPPERTINYFHTSSPWMSIISVFRKKNPVYFESYAKMLIFLKPRYKNFSILKKYKCYENEISKAVFSKKIFKLLLSFSRIENFIFLDDSRHTGELRMACKELNIKMTGYMHARFNEYHVGLFKIPFDNYLVWSDYFFKILQSNCNYYDTNNVIISGHPYLRRKFDIKDTTNSKKINILWIGESNVNYSEIYIYIYNILINNNFNVIFRGKPGEKNELTLFLQKNQISVDNSDNLFESLDSQNIDLLIGTVSTALIESYLLGIPSLVIKSSNDYASHLWKDNICKLCSDPKTITRMIYDELSTSKISKQLLRQRIWGIDNGLYNEKKINDYFLNIKKY